MGRSYLLWKNDGNHIGASTSIWAEPLDAALMPAGGVTQLLTTDEAWQGSIIEGPDMYETPTHAYYLFYSGGDEGASTYAIGWAACPGGPSGACSDQSSSPLLGSEPGMSGPGGPDVYTLPGGQTVMAFAAWQGTTIGYLDCGIRPMYLADLSFGPADNGSPTVSSSNPSVTPSANPVARNRRHRRLDTGRSPPTAASSPSGRPASSAPPDPCGSTSRWSGWR